MTIDKIINFMDQLSEFKRLILLLIAGSLSSLSFAPFHFIATYFICFCILLTITMNARSNWSAFLTGYVFGIGHFYAGLYWIGNSFAVEASVPDWAGYFMVFALSSFLAIYSGLATGIVRYIHKNHSLKTHLLNCVLTFVVTWSLMEWLRGVLFTGFPWNLSGYIWGFSDTIMQSTAIWGVYGLGVITLLLCFLPLFLLTKNTRIIAPVLALFLLSGLFYYGNDRLSQPVDFVEDINLRIVQPNIKQQDKWPYENWSKNLIRFLDMSEADDKKPTTHMIWPETAIIYSLSEEPFRRQLISKVLGPGGMILTGFPRRQRDDDKTRIYNSMIAIGDQGQIEAIYDKSHLVPGGEYIPDLMKDILMPLGFGDLFTGGQDFSQGKGLETLHIKGLPPVGVLICYEVIFPGKVVDPDDRPEWILNLTNDAWYGDSTGPYQHLLQTRVRAIEEGMAVVRSASTGISAMIDPYGRVIDNIALNKTGVIDSPLPKAIEGRTIYSNMKEWIFACLNVTMLLINILLVRRSALRVR